MNIKTYTNYLIHLIKCAIIGEQPNQIPEGIELQDLFVLAQQHKVENIIYLPLKELNIQDEKIMPLFEELYNHAIINDATQQYYLELVTDELEAQGIRHCIMKGPVVKKLYPSSDMRQSGDLDIFVDDENTEKAREIMESLEFATESFSKANSHDEYKIDQNIIIEIHRSLISNKCEWQEECQKITDRLVLTDGFQCRYDMTKEDYYLYMIGHMAKHMKYTGMGIKMVLDVWVYLNAYNDILDWDKLNGFLNDCKLLEFEQNIKRLCDCWFNEKATDGIISKLSDYIVLSGNFGTEEQFLAGEMAKNAVGVDNKNVSKIIYYIKLFFLPYNQMCDKYGILRKIPVLLPVLWLHRAIKTAFFDKEKADLIKNRYEDADMEYGKKIIEFKKNIGL